MKLNRKQIAYVAYGVAAAILFLYLLFPSEQARDYLVYSAGELFPEAEISMESLELAFPPGLNVNMLTVQLDGGPLLRAPSVRLRPVWISLARVVKKIRYDILAFGGVLKGESEVVLSGESEGFRVVADIRNARLAEMDFLRRILPTEIEGLLDGAVTYDRKAGQADTMNVRMELKDCSFRAALPIIDFGRLEFGHVSMDASLADRQVQIRQLDFKGSQADGRITGHIRVHAPFSQSILNLRGTFAPHPAYVAELSKTLPVQTLLTNRDGREGVGFSIRGTFAKPVFNFTRG